MKYTTTLLAAATVTLGMATSASALTVSPDMTVDITPNVNNAFEIVFTWPDSPIDGTEAVPIAFDFNLSIEASSGTNTAVGYFIEDPDGIRLQNASSTTCADGTPMGAQCNLLFSAEQTPMTLFSDLAAGTYTFGVFGGTVPNAGSLTFGITKVSEVPLPAGGVLLLSALGGFAAMRRRKS